MDKEIGGSDQTLEHRKQQSDTHNKVHQEIHGTGNIFSATGDVNVNNVNIEQHHHHDEQEKNKCKRYEELIFQTPNWLLILEFVVISVVFLDRWHQEITLGNTSKIMFFEFILIVETILLGFLWLISAKRELYILECHLKECLPGKEEGDPEIIAYIIPFSISILLFFVNYIYVYAAIFWVYTCFDVFARKTATYLVYEAVQYANIRKVSNNAIEIIYSYYVENHFEVRGYLFGSVFLAVFLVGMLTSNLIEILYITAIANIILSELVIWCWRIPFYNQMKRIKKELLKQEAAYGK